MFATDGCTYSLNIKYTESRIDGSCDNDYIILRVWSVADECGNKVTEDCSITVDDDTPPVFIGKIPANRSDDCDDISLQPTFGTYDDCGGYVKYEEGEEHINGSCPHEYQLRRWYTAEDSCGNSVSDEYYVDVVDNDSPVFLTKPGDTTLECHEDLPYAKLEATDNCGYDVTVTPADEVTLPLSCEEEYTSIREWTAVDACGLEDVHVQTVTKILHHLFSTNTKILPLKLVIFLHHGIVHGLIIVMKMVINLSLARSSQVLVSTHLGLNTLVKPRIVMGTLRRRHTMFTSLTLLRRLLSVLVLMLLSYISTFLN
jgi:hypothetical protein